MTNDIYLSLNTKLQNLLDSYNTTRHHACGFLRRQNPEFIEELSLALPFLNKKSPLSEIEYVLANQLNDIPKCICGNPVKWKNIRKYAEFCSVECSTPDRMKRMNKTLGVVNTSQLQSSKDKKKETCLERYNVDNAAKIPEARKKISQMKRKHWNDIYGTPGIKEQAKLYTIEVRLLTEQQYRQFKHLIDPKQFRSKTWELDHVFSIYDGFLHGVPIEVVSHWSNLKIVSSEENRCKGRKSNKTLTELYEDYKKGSLTTPG